MRRKIAAGNWKMNGDNNLLDDLTTLTVGQNISDPEVIVCPPHTLLNKAVEKTVNSFIKIGGQDCHVEKDGAYTGDISASMIAETGAKYVIVGHSERRDGHNEDNQRVRAKVQAAWSAGLIAILCIGESAAERSSKDTLTIIGTQLHASLPDDAPAVNTIVAYEPIWAIVTGKTPTLNQIKETHDMLRDELINRFGTEGMKIRLLYGGSVKATNATEIFQVENVDGALVGGASLKATDFQPIIDALAET